MKFEIRFLVVVILMVLFRPVYATHFSEFSFNRSDLQTILSIDTITEVALSPANSPQNDFEMAMELMRNGQLMEAYRIFENIVSINKEDHASFYQMALIGYQFGALDVADNAISNALLIKPTELNYWVFNLEVNRRLQSKEKMIIAMDNVMKLKPEDPEMLSRVISDYYQFEEKEKAQNVIQYAEQKLGSHPAILLAKARFLKNEKQFEEAEILLNNSIQTHPQITDAYILLAEVYRMQKKYKDGFSILDKAQNSLGKSIPLIEFSRADIYREQKNKKKSIHHLSLGLQNPELDFQNQSTVIINSLSFYKLKDLESVFSEYLSRNQDNAVAYLVMGDVYVENNQEKKALELYRQSLQINPENKDVWNMVLTHYLNVGSYNKVIEEGQIALQVLPDEPHIHYLIGSAYYVDSSRERKERFTEARYSLEKALDLESAREEESVLLVSIYSMLGDIYNGLEMYAASNVAYEESLRMDSTNVYTLNNYAYYLSIRKENLEDALSFSAKTLEFDGENPTFLDTYAWVLYQMKEYPEAKEYLEKALKNSPDPSADIFHHYGDILYQLDDVKSAVKYWKKALKLTNNQEKVYGELKAKIDNRSLN